MSNESAPAWMRALKPPAPIAPAAAAATDDRPLSEVVAAAKERAKALQVLPRNTRTWLTCRVASCAYFGAGLTQVYWNGSMYMVTLECPQCKKSGHHALAEYGLSFEELRLLLTSTELTTPLSTPCDWPVRP